MLRRLLILVVVSVSAVSAAAQTQSVSVPKYTVVPVSATCQLNSSVTDKCDPFVATADGSQSCYFPAGTSFIGSVTKVVRGSGRTPGQIAVTFERAQFPDGTCVPIKGALVALDEGNVCPGANNQCLVARPDSRDARSEFIAGENCAVYIGLLCRGNAIIGASTNIASLCPPTGVIKAAGGQDVIVTCGTKFGVMLEEAACVPVSCCPAPACPPAQGAGPGSVTISFASTQPFVVNCALMVPLQVVMDATGTQYQYDPNANMVSFTTSQGPVTHKIGSNVITVSGQDKQLSGYSGVVGNVIYLPSDAIAAASCRCVTWDADKCLLKIQ